MILEATWSYPTEIRFGAGRVRELGNSCISSRIRNPLLVTDRTLLKQGIAELALDNLEKAGFERNFFADVEPNPTDRNLAAGIQAFNEGEHDGVVAIGGGSSLDLGKLVAFMAKQTRPVWDFEDVSDHWTRANDEKISSIIAVPTTAGTGSEVSRAAVLLNAESNEKKIIFHPRMLPRIVICDPELTVSMPSVITIGTGMDAFAHCLEAYSSNMFHPMSQGIALEGMRLVKNYLPRAAANSSDLEARSNMMAAAGMGAVAFQKGLGAIHALSHPIGAICKSHHGMTNAILIPPVLRLNQERIFHKIKNLANFLDIQGGFEGFYNFVTEFMETLGIPDKLSSLGVKEDHIDEIVRMALSDPSASNNPVALTEENMRALLEKCI